LSKPNQNKGKLSDQSRRFIEAAREAECSEDEAAFDEVLRQIAKAKPPKAKKPKK
jgi:hypothetical protein